jgi:hypothetical protein
MNGKAMVFVVFHCTRCRHWYWPLPSIESLIFLWWGKLSSNATCLFLATNTYQVKGFGHYQVVQDAHKLKGSSLGAPAYAIMYLVSITHTKLVQSYSVLPGGEEQPSESKDHPNKRIIHHTHFTVVVSVVKKMSLFLTSV